MKRLSVLIIALLISTTCLADSTASGTFGFGSAAGGGGGGNLAASDDFNTSDSLAGWTQSSGSWNETGAVLASSTTGSNVMIMYSTASTTTSQVMEYKLNGTPALTYRDIILRAAGTSTDADMIVIEFEGPEGNIKLYRTASYGGSWTQLGSTVAATQTNGHYYGIKISGASNSLSVAIYDNGTSSDWANRATWSSPIASWTGQDASAVTLGNYMGFGLYQSNAGDATMDDWQGADQ